MFPYSEVYESTRIQRPLLVRAEKSKMASKMAARYKCKRVLYLLCTILIYFNKLNKDIHFRSLCLNFFMIHLNMVSRSNSRSHEKKTMERAYLQDVFRNYRKVSLNGKKCYISK